MPHKSIHSVPKRELVCHLYPLSIHAWILNVILVPPSSQAPTQAELYLRSQRGDPTLDQVVHCESNAFPLPPTMRLPQV